MSVVSQSFKLLGYCPSKKSSRMWTGKKLIMKPEYQLMLGPLLLQARAQWHGGKPLTLATIHLTFLVSNLSQDLDGAAASAMDLLVKAGIIVDDSMRHVIQEHFDFRYVDKGAEGVIVTIQGTEADRKAA